MKSTGEKLKKVLVTTIVRNHIKLDKQQKYYQQLKKKGIAHKQSYNVKAIAAI